MFQENQMGLQMGDIRKITEKTMMKDVITDRKSKYTVTAFPIEDKSRVKEVLKELKKLPYFRKATHNTYAFRIGNGTGVEEGKNDDGETGAGMCVLRELQRANFVDTMVIVTRYFGGIHLGTDRFKHVIDATKKILE